MNTYTAQKSYKFYQFFVCDFLGQSVLIPPLQNVSQGTKCPNSPNLYTTPVEVHIYKKKDICSF